MRYEHPAPGDLLHLDVKKLARIPDGGGHRAHGRSSETTRGRGAGLDYLHVAVDDHSRYAYVETLPDERGATCAAFLERALAHFRTRGVAVRRVLTDNARNYTVARVFLAVADANGLTLKLTRPYRPQTNGKAQRFIQTLLNEWAYARPYRSKRRTSATSSRAGSTATMLADRTAASAGLPPPRACKQRSWDLQLGALTGGLSHPPALVFLWGLRPHTPSGASPRSRLAGCSPTPHSGLRSAPELRRVAPLGIRGFGPSRCDGSRPHRQRGTRHPPDRVRYSGGGAGGRRRVSLSPGRVASASRRQSRRTPGAHRVVRGVRAREGRTMAFHPLSPHSSGSSRTTSASTSGRRTRW